MYLFGLQCYALNTQLFRTAFTITVKVKINYAMTGSKQDKAAETWGSLFQRRFNSRYECHRKQPIRLCHVGTLQPITTLSRLGKSHGAGLQKQ